MIIIAPNWPRKLWYVDLKRLLADSSWAVPGHPNILSQGPVFYPASRSLVKNGMVVETQVLKDIGLLNALSPTLLRKVGSQSLLWPTIAPERLTSLCAKEVPL